MTRKHANAYLTFNDVQTAVARLRITRADRRFLMGAPSAHRRALEKATAPQTIFQKIKGVFKK